MENMFETLHNKKEELAEKVKLAKEFGWIDELRYKELLEKINNDILTIGVIGQMKCGKSTFLNTFVFEEEVLPAATTPMTAALSVITYGETERIEAEFYNEEEWAEMKIQAERDLEEVAGNSLIESKIKAAKELVAKSKDLGDAISSLLSKGTQEDTLDNLIEYVGAEGKYVSITKSVKIYSPKEYLKGVEIVDTPGFNDPIVSREERTNDFLKKADVVLMMLYAGRPFDATDRDIIFQNVRQCGIGKVLIGINKYDIPYENGETEQEIKDYVKHEIDKACRECKDDTLVEILRNTEPISVSAEMSLLSQLPMSKINADADYKETWNRFSRIFEISNQSEMRQKSKIDDLTSAIKDLVLREKEDILFKKTISALTAAGANIRDDNANHLRDTEFLVQNLSKPDYELEEEKDNLTKAQKRFEKKINALNDDLNYSFKNSVREANRELENTIDAACNKMETIINNDWPKTKSSDYIKPKLEKETQTLHSRELKRALEDISKKAERTVTDHLNDFMTDAEVLLMKYLPKLDSDAEVKRIRNNIDLEIKDKELFSYSYETKKNKTITKVIENSVTMFFGGAVGVGIKEGLKAGWYALTHDQKKAEILEGLLKMRDMDLSPYLDSVFGEKDELIVLIKKSFMTELIDPLQKQVDEILANSEQRAQELVNANMLLSELRQEKEAIDKQFVEIGLN